VARVRGVFGEYELARLAEKAFAFAPLGPLRHELEEEERRTYVLQHAQSIKERVSYQEFRDIRMLLGQERVEIQSAAKGVPPIGFLTENLTVATVVGRDKQVVRPIGIAGICLPARINLQTMLPLFAAKEMMKIGVMEKLYIALPVGAYGMAQIPRFHQYQQVVGMIDHLFGNDAMGESVVLMPDYLLHRERSMLAAMISLRIKDTVARQKYPFGNLFSYCEVAGYGADIALPALVERQGVMVVADFMQYESIHAGVFATKEIGQVMSAVILDLLSPHTKERKLIQVSHMNEQFDVQNEGCAEINPVFLAGLLVMSEEEAREVYRAFAKTSRASSGILERVQALQAFVASGPAIGDARLRELEERSVKSFVSVQDTLHDELQKRMTMKAELARNTKGGFV